MPQVLFPLGTTVITPGALRALMLQDVSPLLLYDRHAAGDWSDMEPEDQASNAKSVHKDGRIFSSYRVGVQKQKVWVITKADRSVTTILLPLEY